MSPISTLKLWLHLVLLTSVYVSSAGEVLLASKPSRDKGAGKYFPTCRAFFSELQWFTRDRRFDRLPAILTCHIGSVSLCTYCASERTNSTPKPLSVFHSILTAGIALTSVGAQITGGAAGAVLNMCNALKRTDTPIPRENLSSIGLLTTIRINAVLVAHGRHGEADEHVPVGILKLLHCSAVWIDVAPTTGNSGKGLFCPAIITRESLADLLSHNVGGGMVFDMFGWSPSLITSHPNPSDLITYSEFAQTGSDAFKDES
ncbi:hypothetical protein B0H14DRAFT_3132935 [Mycena olivaceomarginata]|nr:hypothetical protein B0H14DRAFT_3132935 [Mycena olivaceomarginata]